MRRNEMTPEALLALFRAANASILAGVPTTLPDHNGNQVIAFVDDLPEIRKHIIRLQYLVTRHSYRGVP